jgi:hypothetical protein
MGFGERARNSGTGNRVYLRAFREWMGEAQEFVRLAANG